MHGHLVELAAQSKALNSKIFSLPRILLLSALEELPEGEGAIYRELKASLEMDDGVVFANLKVLAAMGYVLESKVKLEKEEMTQYVITPSGREALAQVRTWLVKWSGGGGNGRHQQGHSNSGRIGHKAESK